tara:strand:- start:1212 stop:1838 length:627 start_codon:yes stop_codon:yes gene_type:complete
MSDALSYGEEIYFESIKDNVSIIFDVGSQKSEYLEFSGEVHYFEPVVKELNILKNRETKNTQSYFNDFALGDDKKSNIAHYGHGALFNRNGTNDNHIDFHCNVIPAEDYIVENNISRIDFLKIDVEGYELEVLNGFRDKLSIVNHIQFEYGIGLRDNGHNLSDIINLLQKYSFEDFCTQTSTGLTPLTNYNDDWVWKNIVCKKKSNEL